MTAKYILYPWAVAGQTNTIPNPTQGSGSVSYQQGWSIDYSLDLLTDPAAKVLARLDMNGVINDITTILQQYQQNGFFPFITAALNGGVAFPYSANALASYDNLDGNGPYIYRSLTANNVSTPLDAAQWQREDFYISAVDSGSANAYVVNSTIAYPTILDGATVKFTTTNANTGPSTFKRGTDSAQPIMQAGAGGLVILSGAEIQPGVPYFLEWNLTAAAWILLNPTSTSGVPTGTSLAFRGASPPAGYLLEDGGAVSRTAFAALFSVIGVVYGAGDGVTTFNVPDSRRRVDVGSGGTGTAVLGNTTGNTGGEEAHAQTISEMPGHNHAGSTAKYFTNGSNGATQNVLDAAGTGNFNLTIASQGGGNPFNVIQPSLVATKMIKT